MPTSILRWAIASMCLVAAFASTSSAGPASETDAAPPDPAWLQWGGPGQDFHAPATTLAATWPESGPPRLWERRLGEGYSAILYEAGRLYTMYSDAGHEAVVCLDAATGATIWEHRYQAIYGGLHGWGGGPRATPAIAGERLFTVGVEGTLLALRKSDGEVSWRRELWGEELGGNRLDHGYSSSPFAYRDLVIVPVGGEGGGLVAFDQASGKVVWKSLAARNSYSSPLVVELLGEEQLVVFMAHEVVGVAPATGELRWSFSQENQWEHNITLPIVVGDDTLFISSAQAGARGLRLRRGEPADEDRPGAGGTIEVEQIWATRRVQFYHSAAVRDGDWVYGSSGTASPAFLSAIHARTGEIGWRLRGFAKANCVMADGRLLILGEDGVLSLATASPAGLEVHARTQLLGERAWTVPTVVGRTLYARDQERILAVDLG